MSDPVLRIENLAVEFATKAGPVRAVDGVSLALDSGEVLAVVGESGCGKSVTALSVLGLVASPGRITAGSIRYGGTELLSLNDAGLRHVRGKEISMIFQEPMTSLNPVLSIGHQIEEVLRLHEGLSRADARRLARDLLDLVQIPEPERRLDQFPHELSGGMRQRVMIAMALACRPKILIADEPTTALDVTIQAQILDLIRNLRRETGMAVMLITHDLGVVAEMADRVAVMYAGKKVEEAPVRALFRQPLHPYTLGLLGSTLHLGASGRAGGPQRLAEIPGSVPILHGPRQGCAFAPRCTLAIDKCRSDTPVLEEYLPGQVAACWRAKERLSA